MWTSPPFFRCQRNQGRVSDSSEAANANIAPSWNLAPTDPLPVVRFDAKERQRSLDVMRWGLVPFWAKDIKVGFVNMARSNETPLRYA